MDYDWLRKNDLPVLQMKKEKAVVYFKFPILEASGLVQHGFSSRLGGVSEEVFASLNFSFHGADQPERVLQNYHIMAGVLEQKIENMVLSHQTHTTNVKVVNLEDAGKGLVRERDYQDIDGLVTNVPGLMLVTLYADCIPLYFLDPVKKAIGLSHSGWRGTVGKMAAVTLAKMKEEYGTEAADVIACIGPGICQDCYEVGSEVAEVFQHNFGSVQAELILKDQGNGKYQLDLWQANKQILLDCGVLTEHIAVTNTCTCCNPALFYSHRKMGTARGNLAAFLALREPEIGCLSGK